MQYQNEAYDLSLFDTAQKVNKDNVIRLPKRSFNANKAKKLNIANFITMAIFSLSMITIVSTLVYSQVRLTELTEEINIATKQLNEQESIYTQLQMKADSELSLRTVEEYARNNLHMSKAEPAQIKYIKIANGDKAQVKGNSFCKGLFSSIKNLISDVVS